MNVFFTEQAETDIDHIAEASEKMFGARQRDRYLRMLRLICLETVPQLHAHRCAAAVLERPGLWRLRAEGHYIYFREVSDGLEIVRVLHTAMEQEEHL